MIEVKSPLYQWDLNLSMTVDTDIVYVDFVLDDEVLRVEPISNIASIPNQWLQTSGKKRLFLCHSNDTKEGIILEIKPRPLPPDYVYTPTQVITFNALVDRVDDEIESLEERAEAGEFDGEKGDKGDKGDTGNCNFATFEINPETGVLTATYTISNSEINFTLNNGYLGVEINGNSNVG